jgi:hypothetical protein
VEKIRKAEETVAAPGGETPPNRDHLMNLVSELTEMARAAQAHLRWVKTDVTGRYFFRDLRPDEYLVLGILFDQEDYGTPFTALNTGQIGPGSHELNLWLGDVPEAQCHASPPPAKPATDN